MIHEIEIDLPVNVVYDQWTQFEDFPLFMKHVKDVQQLDEATTAWKARIAGISREWKAEITEQSPNQRIAWTALDGASNSGVVTFHPLSDKQTKVVLQLEMDPDGFLETVADWGGFVKDRAGKDLDQFRDFVEARGHATGAWRGEITRDSMRDLHALEEKFRTMDDDELVSRAKDADIERPLDRDRGWLVSALAHDEYSSR